MHKATILIIDDEKDLIELVRYNLEKEGYDAIAASDGQAGLEIAQRHKLDLIVLDLMMPNMDGFEFAERLHRDVRFRTIPIVVITAKDLTDEDRRRLNGSVLRVVRKGGSPEGLLNMLRGLTAATPPAAEEEHGAGSGADVAAEAEASRAR